MRAALVALVALVAAPAAWAHEGNPNFLSRIDAVTPAVKGLQVSVVNRDDRFLLHNESSQPVVIEGYEQEPYARVEPDGTVKVNTNSKAYYLNEDRLGRTAAPAGVDSSGPPRWKTLSRSGRFEWHDHRMHYMGAGRPKQVTDPGARTKVFAYRVPIDVGGRPGAIAGTLFWIPDAGGGLPVGAILGFAGVVIALCIVVIIARRRRAEPREAAEAW